MAKLIQFSVFVSLMVCSVYAMDIYITNTNRTYKGNYSIECDYDGNYIGTPDGNIFTPPPFTIKVIVYVCCLSSFDNIMCCAPQKDRDSVANELSQQNYQLLYLGVRNPKTSRLQGLIGAFIHERIRTPPQDNSFIEVLGEKTYQRQYKAHSVNKTYDIFNEKPFACWRKRFNAMALFKTSCKSSIN